MRAFENNFLLRFIFLMYIYISTTMYGWQIICFILAYGSMDLQSIDYNLKQWSEWQLYFIVIGMAISLLFAISAYFNREIINTVFGKLKFQRLIQGIFLLLLLINFLLLSEDLHFHLMELVIFALAIFSISQIGNLFYQTRTLSWFHPTTLGKVYVSSGLQAFACIVIINPFDMNLSKLIFWILVLLIFDMLILFSRFRYLSKFSPATNRIARKLLGTYFLYFGSRIIVGIFMPLIYLIYALFFSTITIKGTGILLLVGTFLAWALFIMVVEDRGSNGVME